VVVLLLLLVVVLTLVARRHYKDRGSAASMAAAAGGDGGLGGGRAAGVTDSNWSIPRPQPRVWQTNASLASVDRRRRRRRRRRGDDDDDSVDGDVELHRRPNGHPPSSHRSAAANGRLSTPVLDQSLGITGPPSVDEQQRTPRLRRYVVMMWMMMMITLHYITLR